LTDAEKSLDDVMRLAYARYSGERGFTPEEFRATASEVAGADLDAWFTRAVNSTEELDYSEMLDWYGLRFAAAQPDDPSNQWTLEPAPGATQEQVQHFHTLLAATPAR
jgi:predicted metalloprotease with PDZ domain